MGLFSSTMVFITRLGFSAHRDRGAAVFTSSSSVCGLTDPCSTWGNKGKGEFLGLTDPCSTWGNKGKGEFLEGLAPILILLHLLPRKTSSCLIWEDSAINAQRVCVHKYPLLCIARYSFIQLTELEQCRVNELPQALTRSTEYESGFSQLKDTEQFHDT